jgi:transposase
MREEVSVVELLVARCAGLDVAKDEVVACVRVPDGRGGRAQEVRTFPTFTSGLEALAGWLAAEGVTRVVMAATGQYWKPVVRHEVPRVRAEVKGLRLRPVAAGR